jgi:hypothetical protein
LCIECQLVYACTNVIEMPLSKYQSVEKIAEDEIIVTATVRETVDLTHWIFSLGENITIIEPQFVKEKIIKTINKMKKNYK